MSTPVSAPNQTQTKHDGANKPDKKGSPGRNSLPNQPGPRPQQVLRGALFFLSAIFLFSALDATAKYLSLVFAVPLLVWARYLVHLLLMLPTVLPVMGRTLLQTKHPLLMLIRTLVLVGVTLLGQLAMQKLPLAETTALIFVAPLLVALLAGPMLGEKPSGAMWLSTCAGLIGVLLIVRPGGNLMGGNNADIGIGVLYALGAALCYAVYQMLTRKLSSSEPPMRLLFHSALFGALGMSCILPFYWQTWHLQMLNTEVVLLIISLGVYGAVGHFLMIRAFSDAPASSLSPLLYVQLIWATLLGFWIFKQLPDLWALLGMTIIGLSGINVVLRSKKSTLPPE
ncbi:MAG: DMT family transporter [Pseudomonadota bacterium]